MYFMKIRNLVHETVLLLLDSNLEPMNPMINMLSTDPVGKLFDSYLKFGRYLRLEFDFFASFATN